MTLLLVAAFLLTGVPACALLARGGAQWLLPLEEVEAQAEARASLRLAALFGGAAAVAVVLLAVTA